MSLFALLILSFLTGALVKLTDDIVDRHIFRKVFSIPPGIAYGLLMGYLMINDSEASILFGGIVLGCLLAGKINSTGHYFGLAAIIVLNFLYGAVLSPLVLVITLFAAMDEMKDVIKVQRLDFVFDYRLILKLGVLLLVLLNIIELKAFLILIAFDSAYLLIEKINSRFS